MLHFAWRLHIIHTCMTQLNQRSCSEWYKIRLLWNYNKFEIIFKCVTNLLLLRLPKCLWQTFWANTSINVKKSCIFIVLMRTHYKRNKCCVRGNGTSRFVYGSGSGSAQYFWIKLESNWIICTEGITKDWEYRVWLNRIMWERKFRSKFHKERIKLSNVRLVFCLGGKVIAWNL